MSKRWSVAVIGSGISGMAAAYELSLDPRVQVTVIEREPHLGGVLQTETHNGWLLDHAADNFIVQPDAAVKLSEELGISDQLIPPSEDDRRALIVHHGKLVPTPEGLALMRPTKMRAVLATPLLSWQAKLRLMWEPFCPKRRDTEDESLADFVRRRLGKEFLQRIVQPLIAGIYTGDAETLSAQATVPQVVEMEQKYGSLFRATLAARKSKTDQASRQASGARYGQFRALKGGSHGLITALQSKLPAGSIMTAQHVETLARDETQRWWLQTASSRLGPYDGVLLGVPAPRQTELLKDVCPEAADELRRIYYASSAIALIGVKAQDLQRPLEGFGFVVPQIEGRDILSVSYASKKYPGRAPEGHFLLRVFMGGAMRPDLMELSDDALIEKAKSEVRSLLAWEGAPVMTKLVRWVQRMPQYHVGHLTRVAKIRASVSTLRGLVLAGNGLDGVGIPQCIRTSREAAKSLIATLGQ